MADSSFAAGRDWGIELAMMRVNSIDANVQMAGAQECRADHLADGAHWSGFFWGLVFGAAHELVDAGAAPEYVRTVIENAMKSHNVRQRQARASRRRRLTTASEVARD